MKKILTSIFLVVILIFLCSCNNSGMLGRKPKLTEEEIVIIYIVYFSQKEDLFEMNKASFSFIHLWRVSLALHSDITP